MNQNASIGKYISILYRRAQSYISGQLRAYNIGSGQYIFLLVLYECDGISQEGLANRLMMDKGTTARALSKLEKAGYVIRETDRQDKRAYNIFITDKARELKPIIYRTMRAWSAILGKDLTEKEKATLHVILTKMVNSTNALYGKDHKK